MEPERRVTSDELTLMSNLVRFLNNVFIWFLTKLKRESEFEKHPEHSQSNPDS